MIAIRDKKLRGRTDIDWLKSYHIFSFGEYYEPLNQNFGPLRVVNDDVVLGGGGFPTHPHSNMEIITYVLSGALEHQDSMGSSEVIRAGEVQKMTAGSGIYHSEFNHSSSEPVHLIQSWIIPDKAGLTPSYDQRTYNDYERKNKLLLIASNDKNGEEIFINQNAKMYISQIEKGNTLTINCVEGRGIFVYLIEGELEVTDKSISTGDAIQMENEETLTISGKETSELIVYDVPLTGWKQNRFF